MRDAIVRYMSNMYDYGLSPEDFIFDNDGKGVTIKWVS